MLSKPFSTAFISTVFLTTEHPDIQDLSLEDEEEEEMVFTSNTVIKSGLNYSLCLVGRFLKKKTIRVTIMKERMANVWSPVEGIVITKAGKGVFTLQFFHHKDMQRVMKGGPWTLVTIFLSDSLPLLLART